MSDQPKASAVKDAPRVVLEAEIGERRFRYVLIPNRTTPIAIVEKLCHDALGKETFVRVSPGNKEEYDLAMGAIVEHLASVLDRER